MKAGLDLFKTEAEILEVVKQMGIAISEHYSPGVVLIGVLRGCVCLMADLLRCLDFECEIDFLSLSAFAGSTDRVEILKDLEIAISGRDVLLVTDVVDTGLSARYVMDLMHGRGAKSVRLASLLDRRVRRIIPLNVDFVGFSAPDGFIVGYGLNLAGRYRGLKDLFLCDLTTAGVPFG